MDDLTTAATNRAAELNLLAACIQGYDPRDVNITPADFDNPKHGAAWMAMCDALDAGKLVDLPTVHEGMGPDYAQEASWLAEIYTSPIMPPNAPAYARQVRQASDLRRLQDIARGLMQRATADYADPADVMGWAREKLDGPTGVVGATETFADTMPRFLKQIREGRPAGLHTPWPHLDQNIHGLAPERMYVIAGRPGGCKSISGQNLAWHWAHVHKQPVFYVSLEMSSLDITGRTVSQVGQITMNRIQQRQLTERDEVFLRKAEEAMVKAPIHMCTDSRETIDTIRNGARQIQRRHGLGLVVVDYLQLVKSRDPRQPRREQVDDIARGLKLMAMSLKVPVVAMAQLNREGSKEKGRPPVLSDLRESGEIEQAADVVILLHRPDPDEPEYGQMFVAKARNGTTGPIDVKFDTWFATVNPIERDQPWK